MIAFLPKLFVALVIVVIASAIAAAVRDLLSNTLSGLSYGRMLATIASIFILALGVIAALNQVGVAVTVPVLIAVLATIGGILVVGVGGGLIKPMQTRWDRYLDKAEDESRAIRHQVSGQNPDAASPSQQQHHSDTPGRHPNPSTQQDPGQPQHASPQPGQPHPGDQPPTPPHTEYPQPGYQQ